MHRASKLLFTCDHVCMHENSLYGKGKTRIRTDKRVKRGYDGKARIEGKTRMTGQNADERAKR